MRTHVILQQQQQQQPVYFGMWSKVEAYTAKIAGRGSGIDIWTNSRFNNRVVDEAVHW